MPKNARNSSPRKPKKRPLLKDGRIDRTTLLYSPNEAVDIDDPNYIVSGAKDFAAIAIEAHFLKTARFCVLEHHLKDISLSLSDVAAVIAATDMPLRGHADGFSGVLKTPKGDTWEIASGLGFAKASSSTWSAYKFDGNGNLVRTSKHSIGGKLIESRDVQIVDSDDKRRISSEQAVAAISVVLDAFGPLRFSLTYDANEGVFDQLKQLSYGARTLGEGLRHPNARILRKVWSHATEALCEQIVRDIADIEKIIGKKTLQAREKLMGPMSAAFSILFGVAATDAPTAFSRFGEAFFKTVGCPCDPKTVKSALRKWDNLKVSAMKCR